MVALRADDVDLDRDQALVRRFQAGDDAAFDDLYRRYYDRLERFCRKRVGDEHAAEEVTQEAFTRALTALPDLGGELRFYPWVSVIAARLCVDYHRRQAWAEPAADPDPGLVAGGQEDIVDAVDASLVVAALARLAPRHQDVLHLREVEGWSYQRIADHYGVKVGTVETLLFRARRALRREFHLVDGAGLVALPLVGRMAQWATRVRSRVPAWVPSPSSPSTLAAAATATAAAVALSVIPGHLPANMHATDPAVNAPAHAITAQPATSGTPQPGTVTGGLGAPAAAPPLSGPSAPAVVPAARTNSDAATTPIVGVVDPATTTTTTTTNQPPPPPTGGAGSGPIGGDPTATVLAIVPPVTLPPLNTVTAALPSVPTPSAVVPSLLAPVGGLGATTSPVLPVLGAAQGAVTNVVGGLLHGPQ
jgi:RNA polymerase sigma factor (sigma-70 family)